MSSKWDVSIRTNTIEPYCVINDIMEDTNAFPNYALCLPKYSKLDGVYTNAPNTLEVGGYGYVSSFISNASGLFTTDPSITIEYARIKSSKGITLVFNELSGDYCDDLTINYYRDGELSESVDFTPNATKYFCSHDSSFYNKLEIIFHKTSKPYRYLFISQFEQYRLTNGKGLEIVYEDLAVGAHDDFEPVSVDVKSLVSIDSLKTTNEFPSYALCLPKYSRLDGEYTNMGTYEQCGYISNSISNASGLFDVNPVLTCEFNNSYSSVGISLKFNDKSGDYCSMVNCKWYNGLELLADKTFTISSYDAFLNKKVDSYNKVVLTFIKTSKPYRNVFVTDIQFGLTRIFDKKTIKLANCLQEINPMSEELSINTLDFTLKTTTDIAFDFQKRQQCVLYFDSNVLGVFYITGGKRTTQDEYEFNTEDIISMLDKEYAYGGFYNANLSDVIADILGDNVDYYLDDLLEDIMFNGYIPYGTKRSALQLVCFATGAVVDTSFDTRMYIYPYAVSDDPKEIKDKEQYLGSTTTESDTIVTGIKVEINNYTANNDSKKLFSGDINGTMELTFNDPHHTYTITGGTIVESGYNYCKINATGSVTLNGCGYDNDITSYIKENPLVTLNKNVAEVSGVLCVNSTNYESITNRLYSWYVGKSITKSTIKVGEHELSESVLIDTFDGERTGLITSMQYGFSSSTMKAEIKIE